MEADMLDCSSRASRASFVVSFSDSRELFDPWDDARLVGAGGNSDKPSGLRGILRRPSAGVTLSARSGEKSNESDPL